MSASMNCPKCDADISKSYETDDLLTALKVLVSVIENPKDRRASLDAHIRSANAVIARAEGRS